METFGFSEKADLRAENVRLVSRPGYLGVAYHVAGVMEFDVEIDTPGTFSSLQFSDCRSQYADILKCRQKLIKMP